MSRLYLDQPLHPDALVPLESDAAHYLGRVLRLREGDGLTVFNGQGGAYHAQVAGFSRRGASLRIGDFIPDERESALSITLLQGLARPEHMDWVMQKTTELGVARIAPVICARTQAVQAEVLAKRLRHWRQVIVHACEQCGRNQLPTVEPARRLDAALAEATGTRLLADAAGARGFAEIPPAETPTVTLLIGPEGGLTDEERQAAQGAGFTPIALGPRVLRTETAAVVLTALAQAWWGDLSVA